jgi:hypothetical protein
MGDTFVRKVPSSKFQVPSSKFQVPKKSQAPTLKAIPGFFYSMVNHPEGGPNQRWELEI